MHADDADGARRDERFDVRQIHDEGVVNVGEHRLGAEMHQRFHARKRRVAGHDDFVARPDALKLVQQIDDHRPRTAEDALRGAGVRGEFGFEGLAIPCRGCIGRSGWRAARLPRLRRSRNIWITVFCS